MILIIFGRTEGVIEIITTMLTKYRSLKSFELNSVCKSVELIVHICLK